MIKILILCLASLLVGSAGFAEIVSDMQVEARVVAIKGDTVSVVMNKKSAVVPRSYIHMKNLAVPSNVVLQMTPAEFSKLNDQIEIAQFIESARKPASHAKP